MKGEFDSNKELAASRWLSSRERRAAVERLQSKREQERREDRDAFLRYVTGLALIALFFFVGMSGR